MATASTEKAQVDHIDARETLSDEKGISGDGLFDEKEVAKYRKRIDWRLLPALGLIHGISLMDRKNTSNAAIAGMLKELDMDKGMRYNLVNLVFFFSMVSVQSVGAILCRKAGAQPFLSGVCFCWGVVVMALGFVNTWWSMIPLRLLLGLFEAGITPGAIYLISTWYTRFEVGRRFSFFYLTGLVLSALSGPLALGLQQLHGKGGVEGWRWIFILEGVITCAVAMGSYAALVDFPDKELAKPSRGFLKREALHKVITRLNIDRDDVEAESFQIRKFLRAGRNIEIWGYFTLYFLSTTVTYAFTFVLPILLSRRLKFDIVKSQVLAGPPYLAASVWMYLQSIAADRYKKRAIFIQFNSIVGITGLCVMTFHKAPYVQYFGCMLSICGTTSNAPCLMAWQANNVRGQFQRSFSSTTLTIGGAAAGITGSLIFRSQDAPQYLPGLLACLGCAVAINIFSTGMAIYFQRANKQADAGSLVIHGLPKFRYTI